jgi:ribosome-associated translation inhibitor RaiA
MTELEKEFVAQRLSIVERKLETHSEFDIDGKGGFHLRLDVSPTVEYSLIREARVLEKLGTEVSEGKIRQALISWRKLLEMELRKHKEKYRTMQEIHDDWLRLPWSKRINTPEPPQPPDCEITDRQGHTWHVEKELLDVFDDMVERLDKWMMVDDQT